MTNLLAPFWTEILSRETVRIKTAFEALSEEEKVKVSEHLNKMINEEGWHREQVISALAALEVILDE